MLRPLSLALSVSALLQICSASFLDDLPEHQRALFDYSMNQLDLVFAPPFLFSSPRYSAWYAVGLLARNEDDDVEVASQMIKDVISYQYKDPSKLWYGTFKNNIDAPDPSDVYPPRIYNSYDPNQGLFVCTSWIIVMEEFQHLLDPELVVLMKESMYNATVGDGYRVAGFDGENLRPIYSNPWYMRIMAATYVGNMQGDANMTSWGDKWAEEGIAEFDKFETLSELKFNSGTYTGVTLYTLSLWGYMPEDSVIVTRAKEIIEKTWISVGQYWNPTLTALGGAWDRAYGYDLKQYYGILGSQITGLIGGIEDRTASIPVPLIGSNHGEDAAISPLTPLVSKFHDPYVPDSVISQLKALSGTGHSYFAQTLSPPFDNPDYPRNYTSWTGPGLSVGAVEVDENVVGGPASNPSQFVPANILWSTPSGSTAWMLHRSTSKTISAIATENNLTISYPPSKAFPSSDGPSSNTMTFLFSGHNFVTLPADFLANGTGELPGLSLRVSGNVLNGTRTFQYGSGTINDLRYYDLTYTIPSDLEEVPTITFSFRKV
ncbi:hypothetical protein VNI00_015392 [Paramarasmius palmivorus]|uniref:Uncharacterized protein n=1 Tax=Paramarasmius palmivorus TaxID=297713 RepID=A0AAW0BJN2_9AGAR